MLVYVIRSYVSEDLVFGPITVRANFFAEVPHDDMKALNTDDRDKLKRARDRRQVSVHMVENNVPVAQMNEGVVLQRQDAPNG